VLVDDDLRMVDPPEEDRTYSSVAPLNNQYYTDGADGHPGSPYGKSRINNQGSHAWTAKNRNVGEWVQIDLGRNHDVRGVLIVGKPKSGCPHADPLYIKSVQIQTAPNEDPDGLEYRENGKVWNTEASANNGEVRIVFNDGSAEAKVDHICPAQLYTGRIMCDDGTAVDYGQCCPDNEFCPTGCSESAKYTDNGVTECACEGCPMERKLQLSDEDAFVKAHNYFRCLHGHPELTWDDAVATNANTPAEQSCNSGTLIHSNSYDFTPSAGENLAMGQTSPERATIDWYNEIVDPGYTAGSWGDGASGTGHYTALIWKATTSIGCNSCGTGSNKVWACQYAHEPPNFGAQAEYEENVPQSNEPVVPLETCCAQVYR